MQVCAQSIDGALRRAASTQAAAEPNLCVAGRVITVWGQRKRSSRSIHPKQQRGGGSLGQPQPWRQQKLTTRRCLAQSAGIHARAPAWQRERLLSRDHSSPFAGCHHHMASTCLAPLRASSVSQADGRVRCWGRGAVRVLGRHQGARIFGPDGQRWCQCTRQTTCIHARPDSTSVSARCLSRWFASVTRKCAAKCVKQSARVARCTKVEQARCKWGCWLRQMLGEEPGSQKADNQVRHGVLSRTSRSKGASKAAAKEDESMKQHR